MITVLKPMEYSMVSAFSNGCPIWRGLSLFVVGVIFLPLFSPCPPDAPPASHRAGEGTPISAGRTSRGADPPAIAPPSAGSPPFSGRDSCFLSLACHSLLEFPRQSVSRLCFRWKMHSTPVLCGSCRWAVSFFFPFYFFTSHRPPRLFSQAGLFSWQVPSVRN